VAALEVEVGLDWRERAVDADALALALEAGERVVSACRLDLERIDDVQRRADLGRGLQRLGRALALAGRAEAVAALEEALGIWRALERASATFLVQLLIAQQADDLSALVTLAARTRQEQALAPYEDTAALYLGCAWARRGELEQARGALEAALRVRQGRGKQAPIAQIEGLLVMLAG
jgi:tetratricopeptide (TPR) repeat protein